MNNYEELLATICASITVSIILTMLILYLIYEIIYTLKTNKMRQNYIKTLNEHDKSVVLDYKNCCWTLKKHKTNNETNKEHIKPKI